MNEVPPRLVVVGLAGLTLGVLAEWVAFPWREVHRWLPDLAVGWSLLACGLIGWYRRPGSRVGQLLVAAGYAWFIPNFASLDVPAVTWLAGSALYLHRGPLIHAILAFALGHLRSGVDRLTVVGGYAAGLVAPLPASEIAVAGLAGMVILAALRGSVTAVGPDRRARLVALPAAVALALVLLSGAAARVLFPAGEPTAGILLAYQVTLVAVGVHLAAALVRGGWERASVTDLVVGLAEARSETVRDALARALGDPSLQIAYSTVSGEYVDEAGRPITLPESGNRRALTAIELQGRTEAVLVHDPAVLQDPGLVESISVAARLAAVNARLQAEVLAQIEEVQASRGRLIAAADQERQRLQNRLRDGAEKRLELLASYLTAVAGSAERTGPEELVERLRRAQAQIEDTRDDLRELAKGLNPALLSRLGLRAALESLAADSPVPTDVAVSVDRLGDDAAAVAYFVCAEALSNAAKHARASRCTITVDRRGGWLAIVVADDGVGGAVTARGSGLRGLSDRVEALGGTLALESQEGWGTRLIAQIPSDDNEL